MIRQYFVNMLALQYIHLLICLWMSFVVRCTSYMPIYLLIARAVSPIEAIDLGQAKDAHLILFVIFMTSSSVSDLTKNLRGVWVLGL